ncbi:hypothetical protein IC615_25595 [Serratia ureilytica]
MLRLVISVPGTSHFFASLFPPFLPVGILKSERYRVFDTFPDRFSREIYNQRNYFD